MNFTLDWKVAASAVCGDFLWEGCVFVCLCMCVCVSNPDLVPSVAMMLLTIACKEERCSIMCNGSGSVTDW